MTLAEAGSLTTDDVEDARRHPNGQTSDSLPGFEAIEGRETGLDKTGLAPNIGGEQRAEAAPPQPDRLVTNANDPLEQLVLAVAQ